MAGSALGFGPWVLEISVLPPARNPADTTSLHACGRGLTTILERSFRSVCISLLRPWMDNRLRKKRPCGAESEFAVHGGITSGSHALSQCFNSWQVTRP